MSVRVSECLCVNERVCVYGDHRPSRPTVVYEDNRESTRGQPEVSNRWFQHFKKVLNI